MKGIPARRLRGFALPVVLLVLAVMSMVAVRLAETSRTAVSVARDYLAEAKARQAADAGYATMIAMASGTGMPAEPLELVVDDARVTVSTSAEAGKIDLNTGDPALLAGILRVVGAEEALAAAVTDAIVALRYDPEGQILRTVDGLMQLPGMNFDLLERLRPFVTVHNGSVGVEVSVAPREVLMAIPDIRPGEVEEILAARAEENPLPRDVRVTLRGYRSRGRPVYTVHARAVLPGGAEFLREAVVDLGDPREPLVLSWRRGFAGIGTRDPGG